MLVRALLLLLLLAGAGGATAQPDSSHLRISLVTCGAGSEEVYEVFGHTAVRITDSANGTDLAYNYGTFAFGPDFEMQFARGKLLYSLSAYPFREFLQEYSSVHRSVEEQELKLTGAEKVKIASFLEWNALPANRNYKYDFFFDNCATRIRDIFPAALGSNYKFAATIPADSKLTYRDIMNQYFRTRTWERLGCNILLGSKIDQVMSNKQIMFLPDYLRNGVAGSTVNDRVVAAAPVLLLPGSDRLGKGSAGPMLLVCLLAALTLAGLLVRRLKTLGRIMTFIMLLVTGLLGCLILVMWFATNHQACRDNLNILWLMPVNLLLAFYRPRGAGRYALIAIALVLLSVVFHLLGTQRLIAEFIPLMLSLLFIYGTIYRSSLTNQRPIHASN